MIDLAFLEKLLDLLNRSDAQSIEIRKWTTTVKISKNAAGHGGPVTYQMSAPATSPAPPAPSAPPQSAGGGGAGGAGGASAGPPPPTPPP